MYTLAAFIYQKYADGFNQLFNFQLRSRIIEVQHALQEAQRAIAAAAPAQKDTTAWNDDVLRVDVLREELMTMLSAARRRKSVVDGVSFDFEVRAVRRLHWCKNSQRNQNICKYLSNWSIFSFPLRKTLLKFFF